jgi:uncharacterized protein (TIGR04255 family)
VSTFDEVRNIYQGIDNSDLVNVGLRYLNLVNVETDPSSLSDYFEIRPCWPKSMTKDSVDFNFESKIPTKDNMDLIVRVGSERLNQGTGSSFVFDFRLHSFVAENSRINVIKWLNEAHRCIGSGFVMAFTERCHNQVFGEVS